MTELIARSVEDWVNGVTYATDDVVYEPSLFALEFVNFIKLVNGEEGEEHKTPELHLKMLDNIAGGKKNIANLLFRGAAKTSVFGEYMFLYLATYGEIPGFGVVDLAIYVSDSIENGVKNMRKNLEYRWENSDFLQQYVPSVRFTDVRWEFHNRDSKILVVKGYGAKALSLDSILYTDQGTTTIGQCQIGDRIFGADGILTSIIAKSDIFHKPMYEIGLMDGRKIKASEDHINSVVHKTDVNNKAVYQNDDLTTKELLALDLFHTRRRISTKGVEYTSKENLVFIENCKSIQYSHRDLPIDPYTLGLLLGDGSLRNDSVVLHGHKDDFPEYRVSIPYEMGKIQIDQRNTNVVSQSVKGLTQKIRDLNLVGHGNHKFIPESYLIADQEQRLELLQGLMDTDGTISARKVRPVSSFTSNSEQLVKDVARLVRSLGGSVVFGRTGHKAHRLQVKLNLPVFKLNRKHDIEQFNHYTKIGIEYITLIPLEPSQCIAVDNAEKQFITTDYTRTHNTGVRGTKEMGKRPVLAVLDDLISDEDARSDTVISSIEDTVYKAVDYALHPSRSKVIWNGTPFNSKDPLYKAIESGAWYVNVFPVCEKYPCTPEEFRGAWPDRFPYSYVKGQYDKATKIGKIDTFNQEMMLRIMSDEDRMILDTDIMWYKFEDLRENKGRYNFYITTDFATSEKTSSDPSVIAVWAVNSKGNWYWVDGIVKRQLMNANIDDLFRLVQKWKPQEVGIEVSAQQNAFISWLQDEMMRRNIWFSLASEGNDLKPGIRPNTNKMQRFNIVVPWFKSKRMWFPKEKKLDPEVIAFIEEYRLASPGKFKSKHDDCIDATSQLANLKVWLPSEEVATKYNEVLDMWEDDEEELQDRLGVYLV